MMCYKRCSVRDNDSKTLAHTWSKGTGGIEILRSRSDDCRERMYPVSCAPGFVSQKMEHTSIIYVERRKHPT